MKQGTAEGGVHGPHLVLLALLWPAALLWQDIAPEFRIGGWLAFNLAVLAAAERWRPHREDWHPGRADLARDGGVFALNALTDGLVKLLVAAVALQGVSAVNAFPFWVQFLGGALLAELGSYGLHRWSHRGGWLWRVHAFHHRPEALNVANALTAHPLNAFLDALVRMGPLVVLGLDAAVITALTMFHLTQSLVAHANIRGHLGLARWMIGNAELHRLHHSTVEREAMNFGTDLPLWDLVFGTYRAGKAPRAVGVFEPGHYPAPTATCRWLAWPFVALGRFRVTRTPSAAAPAAAGAGCRFCR